MPSSPPNTSGWYQFRTLELIQSTPLMQYLQKEFGIDECYVDPSSRGMYIVRTKKPLTQEQKQAINDLSLLNVYRNRETRESRNGVGASVRTSNSRRATDRSRENTSSISHRSTSRAHGYPRTSPPAHEKPESSNRRGPHEHAAGSSRHGWGNPFNQLSRLSRRERKQAEDEMMPLIGGNGRNSKRSH